MASIWTARRRFLLFAALVLVAASMGRELYRWVAFADEREDLQRLTTRVDSAALTVISTRLVADSLRQVIEAADATLQSDRSQLRRMERRADENRLPPRIFEEYMRLMDRYNGKVAARNADHEAWKGVVSRNHGAVEAYNALADTIRALGRRIGEPYISIPTPAEVAVRHGLHPGDSVASPSPPPRP